MLPAGTVVLHDGRALVLSWATLAEPARPDHFSPRPQTNRPDAQSLLTVFGTWGFFTGALRAAAAGVFLGLMVRVHGPHRLFFARR